MTMLRDYQQKASDAAIRTFQGGVWNGIIVLPVGSGKSYVIADIASRLDTPLLVLAPTREIALQDQEKITLTGMYDVGIYSASLGDKNIRKITIATIGSVYNALSDFRLFRYVIVDECHNIDASGGMYERFIHDREDRLVIGLTATPYRFCNNTYGNCLTFLTRTKPRIFDKVLYVCQAGELVKKGYLCGATYFDMSSVMKLDYKRVSLTSSGYDYEDDSLQQEMSRVGYDRTLFGIVMTVVRKRQHNGILVFTRYVRDAERLVDQLKKYSISADFVSGETPRRDRTRIINAFKRGDINVVANASVLVEGFDYPELDTIILAHPTRSLRRYVQEVGRVMRPAKGKEAWVVDLVGTSTMFGRIEDIVVNKPKYTNMWGVMSKGRSLTGIASLTD